MSVPGRVRHLNPEGLPRNPAFTNVVAVDGPVTTIYIGGQNAVTAADEIVGKDGIAAQTEQVFRKLDLALTAAGATLENVVKWTMHVVDGHPISRHSQSSIRFGAADPTHQSSRWFGSPDWPTRTSSWSWKRRRSFLGKTQMMRARKTRHVCPGDGGPPEGGAGEY